jgi:uncharacterized protein
MPRVPRSSVLAALTALAFLPVAGFSAEPEPKPQPKPQQYLYVLRLTQRLYVETAWTDADKAAVSQHFDRLANGVEAGQVILAGRTREAAEATMGLVIFEAENEAAARAFMEGDPAVVAGVMTATLHPYAVALMRK